jgi:hypothetical protein
MTAVSGPEHRDGGRLFWTTTVLGWIIIAGAVVGAFSDRRDAQPFQLVRWVIGGALIHDLLWLPLVALGGVALTRATRSRLPPVVAWALATSVVLILVAWPFVRGYGLQPGNPSLLPRNYAAGLAVYLVVIWLVVLGFMAVGALRRAAARRSLRPTGSPPDELGG